MGAYRQKVIMQGTTWSRYRTAIGPRNPPKSFLPHVPSRKQAVSSCRMPHYESSSFFRVTISQYPYCEPEHPDRCVKQSEAVQQRHRSRNRRGVGSSCSSRDNAAYEDTTNLCRMGRTSDGAWQETNDWIGVREERILVCQKQARTLGFPSAAVFAGFVLWMRYGRRVRRGGFGCMGRTSTVY